jgi:hypothetical protein
MRVPSDVQPIDVQRERQWRRLWAILLRPLPEQDKDNDHQDRPESTPIKPPVSRKNVA